MEWLFIIALAAGGLWLKRRLDRVENRARALEAEIELLLARTARVPEPSDAAATRAKPSPVSVPTVRSDREVERMSEPASVSEQDEPDEAFPPAPVEPEPTAPLAPRFDFEDMFGRKLPIWAGGLTLAVAGVLLVRYSIEAGLLTERVRVALSFLFGLILLAAAEFAHRHPQRVGDPRICQAFAGAGLATLYAGFYLAGSRYGLMGQGLAFLGLAAVTAAAIGLSLRFGLPAAILGLVGGFAAPALIGGEDANLPLLALYLALVTGGLSWAGGQQKRTWLGVAALVGGLGWGALILQVETLGSGDILALGLYLTILGAIIPALAEYGSFARFVRLGGAALASIQLAALVATSLHDPLAWGLYLLLGAALAVFGWREGSFREANAIAAGIAIALLIIWDLPYAPLFALVAAGVAAIFAAVPLAHIMRGEDRRVDIGMVGAVPLGIALAAIWQFADPGGDSAQIQLALGLATLAILPLYAAYLVRNRAEMGAFALCTASGQLVIWFALLLVTPAWAAPLTMLPIFAGTAGIARVRSGKPIDALSWGALVLALMALALTPEFLSESRRLGGLASDASVLRALLRWSTLFAMAAALASVLAPAKARAPEPRLAAALAGGLLYAASAQIVPAPWLAPLAAALAIACHRALPRWPGASAALLGIAVLWALAPLGLWSQAAIASLAGHPVLVDALPTPFAALTRLAGPALALAIVAPPLRYEGGQTPLVAYTIASGLALVALHVVFKHLFALDTVARFEDFGMAERTVWQVLLVGAGWAVWNFADSEEWGRPAAIALGAAALSHYLIYSLILHNPLWSDQAVGPTPIANLLLLSAATGIGAAVLLRRTVAPNWAPFLDTLVMAIVSIAAIALLRQIYAGSFLTGTPLGPTEDFLRSLVGIALALAFLAIGARREERSWRIGSLAIMLVAVVKVFAFDAAGLEGLVRIASFLALGLSLIGIGWFYARMLSGSAASQDASDRA